MADARDETLALGAHLAALESHLGAIALNVLQAGMTGDVAQAELGLTSIDSLDQGVAALDRMIRLQIKQLRK